MPPVATAQLSPRTVRPGALVLYFVFVLPSPHWLETPSPCSHRLSPQQSWSCWTGGLISCVYPGQQDPKHVDPRTFSRSVNREERKQNSGFIFPPLLLNFAFYNVKIFYNSICIMSTLGLSHGWVVSVKASKQSGDGPPMSFAKCLLNALEKKPSVSQNFQTGVYTCQWNLIL